MQNAFSKLLAALLILIVALTIVLHFLNHHAPVASASDLQLTNSIAKNTFHAPPVPRPQPPEFDLAGQPKIPRTKVEEWLAKHNRDAMSLLAAFHALEDTNYLNEAATNFPNNPQVEWTILARGAFPEDRRKWLDLFKASSPSNSLANYLSAEDDFKNGNSDAAVQELSAASGKSQFGDYIMESQLDGEALNQFAGESPKNSTRVALSHAAADMMMEDADLKRLAVDIEDTQKQQSNAGDNNSVANLAQTGMNLGNQLSSGDSGKYFANQLEGVLIGNVVLQQLDPNTSYDFLNGETPSQALQEREQQRKSLSQLAQSVNAIFPEMTEEEENSYFERSKIYGEVDAMQWLIQQHPPNSSQSGQQ
jgi:hypothetical protein